MLASFIIISLLVTVAVVIHYEMLRLLSVIIPKLRVKHRIRVIVGVFGSICAHIIEVWLFGIAFYYMAQHGDFGSLGGNFNGSLVDCVYFSFTNYTTLGYGDIVPYGQLRFLAGMEAITGLSLITWSASFMFMEMSKFWEQE
ncbi:MAG: ion transporter [SAR86 cluster bacterium]|uniref:Ion transporter n=1 Tax=SAR86 cluster bacterium TaxID=2030880 RepID=A0A2A5ADF0_9GAMM|nr:MAG: ion transporter [SAR86 cluster bacterium]